MFYLYHSTGTSLIIAMSIFFHVSPQSYASKNFKINVAGLNAISALSYIHLHHMLIFRKAVKLYFSSTCYWDQTSIRLTKLSPVSQN